MVDVPAPQSSTRKSAILAIGVAGLAAGTLDLLRACILFGWDIPLAIAAGLLGKKAFAGGAGTYVLGVLLHYFIATSAAVDLLRCKPPVDFSSSKLAGVRIVLWRRRRGGHAADRPATFGLARTRSLPTEGFDPRSGRAHGCGGPADCI